MFQSSKHVPPDTYFKFLEAAGASDINGTTDYDRTNYFETLPANQLELALWLESDRMGYLLDKLDAPQLANQQDVVRNERRQSVENRPYGLPRLSPFKQGEPHEPQPAFQTWRDCAASQVAWGNGLPGARRKLPGRRLPRCRRRHRRER